MIQTIDNPILIPQILPLAEHIPDTNIEALERMLIEGVNSPNSKILIDKKDDDIRAFLYASIEGFRGEDVVFIQACYVSPQALNVGYELLTRIRQWAKEKKIKTLVMMTPRHLKAWAKKYRFKLVSHVLKREV